MSSSYAPLLRVLLPPLWDFAARLQTKITPAQSETRISRLKQILELLSCTPTSHLQEASIRQTLAVATLRLNPRLLEHFETEDPSLLPLFNDLPAAMYEHQRTRIEDLGSTYVLILGLIGVIEASGDPGCVGAFGPDDMGIVFEQLLELPIGWGHSITWGQSASFAPLDSAGTFDLRRYAVETVFGYRRQELARNSATAQSACGKFLCSMLLCSWDDGSWITDVVFNTLTESASDEMRDITADFLYHNSECVSQHLQVYNILYEMLRMFKHESLSYVDWVRCRYLRNITKSFYSISMTNGGSSENMQGAIDALLERLINNDLLGTLVLSAHVSDALDSDDDYWQGLHCGQTTRFWGEHIIALARRSNGQQAMSSDPSPPNVAERIREFCLALSELPDEAEVRDEHSEEDCVVYISLDGGRFEEGCQRHLSKFKQALLQIITQPASTNDRWQPSVPAMQPIILADNDQPAHRLHM
ncbi:hypothetical protein BDV93DRAFT_606839, partial [Ceratobasidium sp. AG-I]